MHIKYLDEYLLIIDLNWPTLKAALELPKKAKKNTSTEWICVQVP